MKRRRVVATLSLAVALWLIMLLITEKPRMGGATLLILMAAACVAVAGYQGTVLVRALRRRMQKRD